MPSLIQDMNKSRLPKYNATFKKFILNPYMKEEKILTPSIWKVESFIVFMERFSAPLYRQNLIIWNKTIDLSEFCEKFEEMHEKLDPLSELTKKCLDRQRVVCLLYEQCVLKVSSNDIS